MEVDVPPVYRFGKGQSLQDFVELLNGLGCRAITIFRDWLCATSNLRPIPGVLPSHAIGAPSSIPLNPAMHIAEDLPDSLARGFLFRSLFPGEAASCVIPLHVANHTDMAPTPIAHTWGHFVTDIIATYSSFHPTELPSSALRPLDIDTTTVNPKDLIRASANQILTQLILPTLRLSLSYSTPSTSSCPSSSTPTPLSQPPRLQPPNLLPANGNPEGRLPTAAGALPVFFPRTLIPSHFQTTAIPITSPTNHNKRLCCPIRRMRSTSMLHRTQGLGETRDFETQIQTDFTCSVCQLEMAIVDNMMAHVRGSYPALAGEGASGWISEKRVRQTGGQQTIITPAVGDGSLSLSVPYATLMLLVFYQNPG
ncbi:hypothetical protein C7212DRAFT_346976 [Tuber magnatum]|uniref:C2H2-type domain-containing protein n=1 Tax=Tuber magnatum TaxID=42249 RepID=A0A317SII0_9PEZI|nr:hypothetical protein C7212DRAFT_346976 [Tuber magnatum]